MPKFRALEHIAFKLQENIQKKLIYFYHVVVKGFF